MSIIKKFNKNNILDGLLAVDEILEYHVIRRKGIKDLNAALRKWVKRYRWVYNKWQEERVLNNVLAQKIIHLKMQNERLKHEASTSKRHPRTTRKHLSSH